MISLFKEIKSRKSASQSKENQSNELQIKVVDAFVDAITPQEKTVT
jgi:hypothetical protein